MELDWMGWDGMGCMGGLDAEVCVELYDGTVPVHALAQRLGGNTE